MKSVKTFAAALLASSLAFGAGSALAAPGETVSKSIEVRIDNVDFSSPADVDSLQRQLVRAAVRACGAPDQRLSARQVAQRNACARNAVDVAVQTAGIAPLTVLHANLTPQDKYRSWRAQPSDAVMRMVADAATGASGSAGTLPQR